MTTENRLFRAYRPGCARSTLLYIFVAVFVVSDFCILSAFAFLFPIDREIKPFVWVGLVLGFMFMTVVGCAVAAVAIIRRRASKLDEVFVPLGLAGRGYLTNGRQYDMGVSLKL